MERYPTPPSTSSPQHGYHDGHNLGGARSDGPAPYGFRNDHNDQKSTIYSSFTNASTVVPASTEAWASGYPAPSANKPVDKHPQDFFGITSQDPSYNQPNPIPFGGPPPIGKSYSYDNSHVAHRPAQETYWQTTSDPSSPTQIPQTHPYPETYDPSHPSRPGPPPRRSSSPIPNTLPSTTSTNPYYNPPSQTSQPYAQAQPQPIRRRSSPIPGRISSPLKRPLSPYSLSRPKPRPGFVRRVASRFTSWIRSLFSWMRAHPIKTGLLSFIPILLGTGLVKTVKGVKHFLGNRASKRKEKKHEHKLEKEAKKLEKKWHEDIFGDFKGFAGTKGGPLNGILKIVHLLVNHYCRLTPSNFPRAASILLELYFLDMKNL
ncbi:hypothetical protein BCIN_15g02160 [Botrytis cinerea B05.10]|uniref:Uncharacterized protein n=3 Tax=Botryotinia fuckeliana TaxID=40559 RepID=A0A384K4B1_BOTFB|nr:hypothetical protein BCIN_15g02160 [Botrytis cinerea B05.10]ATZ57665.1 hypothetical protein BCIN_15g02160 [Botrytis cinerea B05.10]CCD47370.1 hypothetical protein BofuT4_P005290.1 [Botrytis cinerea T4]